MKKDHDMETVDTMAFTSLQQDLVSAFPGQKRKRKWRFGKPFLAKKAWPFCRLVRDHKKEHTVFMAWHMPAYSVVLNLPVTTFPEKSSAQTYHALQCLENSHAASQQITNQLIAMKAAEHIYQTGSTPQLKSDAQQFLKQHLQTLSAYIQGLDGGQK